MKTLITVLVSVFFLCLAPLAWLFGSDMFAGVFLLLALWPVIRVALFGTKPAITITVKRDVWGN